MKKSLAGMEVAILVGNGFSEADMIATQRALMDVKAKMKVVSVDQGLVNGMNETGWGHNFAVDKPLNEALAADFDMLVIPGGDASSKKLMTTAHAKRFVGGFMMAHKPVAAFNDGVMMVMNTGDIDGLEMTGPESMKEMMEEAGAMYMADQNMVQSVNVITGGMMDRDAFVKSMIEFFSSYDMEEDEEEMAQAA